MRYYELFRNQAGSWTTHVFENGGVSGFQPHVVMTLGTTTVTLKDASIMPARTNAAIDVLFGKLGLDFVDGFESFTLNFSAMTFSLGAALPVGAPFWHTAPAAIVPQPRGSQRRCSSS